LVSPDRLRFDFTHFEAVTIEQIKTIENEVNRAVRANICLDTQVMDLEEAMKSGATALFEERYGDQVRIVSIPGVSKELCGGTHAHRTGDIGLVKIIGETSVAAGVRRLEAQTGQGAILAMQDMDDQLNQAAAALKVGRQELVPRLTKLQSQLKEAEREKEKLKAQLASAGTRDLLEDAVDIEGVKVLATQVNTDNPKALRELSDTLRDRIGSGVVVLGAKSGKKALLLALVTKDLVKKVHAGNLVKALAPLVGGGGGGKPDLAQAGGQDPDGLPRAMAKAPVLVKEQLEEKA
jgi:alanyl-tRNA synthetase